MRWLLNFFALVWATSAAAQGLSTSVVNLHPKTATASFMTRLTGPGPGHTFAESYNVYTHSTVPWQSFHSLKVELFPENHWISGVELSALNGWSHGIKNELGNPVSPDWFFFHPIFSLRARDPVSLGKHLEVFQTFSYTAPTSAFAHTQRQIGQFAVDQVWNLRDFNRTLNLSAETKIAPTFYWDAAAREDFVRKEWLYLSVCVMARLNYSDRLNYTLSWTTDTSLMAMNQKVGFTAATDDRLEGMVNYYPTLVANLRVSPFLLVPVSQSALGKSTLGFEIGYIL